MANKQETSQIKINLILIGDLSKFWYQLTYGDAIRIKLTIHLIEIGRERGGGG